MTNRFLQATCILALTLPFAGCSTAPLQPKTQRIVLEHAKARDVRAVLKELSKSDKGETGLKMVVVSHEASNSLLLSGPQEKITRAKDVIAKLDQPVK